MLFNMLKMASFIEKNKAGWKLGRVGMLEAIFIWLVRKKISEKVILEQQPYDREGVSLVDFYEKSDPEGKSRKNPALEVRVCLEISRTCKKAGEPEYSGNRRE